MLCLPSKTPDTPLARSIDKYCHGVSTGEVVACRWVVLAVERFLNDLDRDDLEFAWNRAEAAVDLFALCNHYRGPKAGQAFVLEPWQQFIEANVYGWRKNGRRRFRTVYEEVARKNGKSSRMSVAAIRGLAFDGVAGAQVYSAATKRDQAKIVFGDAMQMVKRSPHISRRIECLKVNMNHAASASKFEPLGADADTLDGLDPSLAIVDELHAHKTRDLWDVIESGMGSREEPLMRAITTAGVYRPGSICLEQRKYAIDVLEGRVQDDTFFGIVFCLDDGDDWHDERNWIKANPNLGVSVHLDELREKYQKASVSPAAQNNFRCKRLNEWVNQSVRWLDMTSWKACVADRELPEPGARAFAALDMASTTDFTAFVLFFPESREVVPYFFVPEKAHENGDKKHRDTIADWVSRGFVEATEGNEVDHEYLAQRIVEICSLYDVQAMAFDEWNATAVVQKVATLGSFPEGWAERFPQTFNHFTEPSKKLEAMIGGGSIALPDHPVLEWMASNVEVKTDNNGNIRPVKPAHGSPLRIDGIVALIMAVGRWLRDEGEVESNIPNFAVV